MAAPPGRSTRGDAEDVVERGLRWLVRNVAWFDPAEWENFLPRRKVRAGPLLELLILVRCLRRGPFAEQVEKLSRQAHPLAMSICGEGSFHHELHRAGPAFAYHAHLVGLLTEAGHDLGEARSLIQSVLDSSAGELFAADRPVLNRLELRYVLNLGGFDVGERPGGAHRGESVLATRGGPLFFRDDEVYALTHVVFFLTDFGARPVSCSSAGERERVRDLVLVLLGACLARGDRDLTGELLLCAEVLGASRHELVLHGWSEISNHQRADGAVPSPVHDPAVLSNVDGDKRAAYLFGTCFHTTMVAVMAGSERVRRG